MPLIYLDDLRLNAQISGPAHGPALVLIHALGCDLTIWDEVIPHLPQSLRILRFDQRGHGASDVPPAPYAMGRLITDAERLITHFGMKDTVVLGVSLGGLVAQGLATKRLDLVRGLILSNTAARIGTPTLWQSRIAAVQQGGIAAIADGTLERWFGRNWRQVPQLDRWRNLLLQTDPAGWCGAAAAIAGCDFYTTTAALTLPTLAIAGANDGSTPPDLVRETAELILGHRFALLQGAGHLPFAEKPAAYAALITTFLQEIGHV